MGARNCRRSRKISDLIALLKAHFGVAKAASHAAGETVIYYLLHYVFLLSIYYLLHYLFVLSTTAPVKCKR